RAVFDLDGAMVRTAAGAPVDIPALVVVTALGLGGHRDLFPDTFAILAETPTAVLVGIDGADHFDVLDSPTVAPVLGGVAASVPLGPVGPEATTSTAQLVRRFIAGALSGDPLTAAELVSGIPHLTAIADYLVLD
ncbi:MAG TPA: hypothetical protein VFY15_07715, partial [Acidimicrobiia bacterium]|nr:hypothetical protein [Acidimicrobiia bacterium]